MLICLRVYLLLTYKVADADGEGIDAGKCCDGNRVTVVDLIVLRVVIREGLL